MTCLELVLFLLMNRLWLPEQEPRIGAYSSIRNLARGFDKITLKQAFQVRAASRDSTIMMSTLELVLRQFNLCRKKGFFFFWQI